ncbi:MAG: hypothetical protein ACI4FX_03775 [Agathobacter sp.]
MIRNIVFDVGKVLVSLWDAYSLNPRDYASAKRELLDFLRDSNI